MNSRRDASDPVRPEPQGALERSEGFVEGRPIQQDTRAVMLCDGDCGLCRRAVVLLQRAGARKAFEYIPFQEAPDFMAAHGMGREQLERELHLITPEGRILRGFFAVRRACWEAPLLWPLALLFSVPGMHWLGAPAYRLVAMNRARLSSACAKES